MDVSWTRLGDIPLCVAGTLMCVCDLSNRRVVVLSTDLSWRYTIGQLRASGDPADRSSLFSHPSSVAAHAGALYVTDSLQHVVQARL